MGAVDVAVGSFEMKKTGPALAEPKEEGSGSSTTVSGPAGLAVDSFETMESGPALVAQKEEGSGS